MNQSGVYGWLLQEYPSTITKEQLYKVCHISKRTALHLLEHGIIPCQSTGKKTRKYTIATADVIAFLDKRDKDPEYGLAPEGWYIGISKPLDYSLTPEAFEQMECYYRKEMEKYPDVMSVMDVADLTGYVKTTVVNWCGKQQLRHFYIGQKYKIPKPWLLEFLLSVDFRTITVKSRKHKAHLAALAHLDEKNITQNGIDPVISLQRKGGTHHER